MDISHALRDRISELEAGSEQEGIIVEEFQERCGQAQARIRKLIQALSRIPDEDLGRSGAGIIFQLQYVPGYCILHALVKEGIERASNILEKEAEGLKLDALKSKQISLIEEAKTISNSYTKIGSALASLGFPMESINLMDLDKCLEIDTHYVLIPHEGYNHEYKVEESRRWNPDGFEPYLDSRGGYDITYGTRSEYVTTQNEVSLNISEIFKVTAERMAKWIIEGGEGLDTVKKLRGLVMCVCFDCVKESGSRNLTQDTRGVYERILGPSKRGVDNAIKYEELNNIAKHKPGNDAFF